MKVSITRPLAMGNGTRPKGFVLGETKAKQPADVTLENTELADGVEPFELSILCENQQYMELDGDIPEPTEKIIDPFALDNKPTAEPAPDPDEEPSEETGEEDTESTPANSTEETDSPFADVEKRALKITAIGLEKQQSKPFVEAGLTTVGDVMDYADKNEGLTSIKGVGDPTEEAVKAALAKLFEI